MRRSTRTIAAAILGGVLIGLIGCTPPDPEYGRENIKILQSGRRQVWAVAPVVNLSGERGVEPVLQADLVFQQLQQIRGVTVIPVNRVIEIYAALRIDRIASADQAALICDLLGCDGVLVTAITIFDPYNPPKLGAAMQLFLKPGGYSRPANIDPRELVRRTTPRETELPVTNPNVVQVVGMFDSANGTVRDRLAAYAAGRHDPLGPLGAKEYMVSMDRYCGFVYSELLDSLILSPKLK